MQSIVLDTNVIVSALLVKDSLPARILDELVLNRKVTLLVSDETLSEYLEVLSREKFARFPDFKQRFHNAETIGRTQIVTPREYYNLHWPEDSQDAHKESVK